MHIRQEGIYQYVRQQGIILQGLADACHSDEDRLCEVEALMAAAGGGKTMGTVATVASAGTVPSCVSSAGSVSSFATARDSI